MRGLLPHRVRGDRAGVAEPAACSRESAVEAGASIALVLAGAGVVGRRLRPRDRLRVRHRCSRSCWSRHGDRRARHLAARQPGRAAARDRKLRRRAADHRRRVRGADPDRHPADRRDPRHLRGRHLPGAGEADHVPALPRTGAVGGRVAAPLRAAATARTCAAFSGRHPLPDDPPGGAGRADDRVGGPDHRPGPGRASSPSPPT